jgi:hypothetical protein
VCQNKVTDAAEPCICPSEIGTEVQISGIVRIVTDPRRLAKQQIGTATQSLKRFTGPSICGIA